jgi:(4S)-4-hydroxy-5-phosphonooxypentane-2,3-dione isomerase
MAKFALVAAFEITADQREQLIKSLLAHKSRCLKDEPGTLQFELLTPQDTGTKVLTYEVYRDVEAFETHRSGASITRFREETATLGAKLSVTRCAVVE